MTREANYFSSYPYSYILQPHPGAPIHRADASSFVEKKLSSCLWPWASRLVAGIVDGVYPYVGWLID